MIQRLLRWLYAAIGEAPLVELALLWAAFSALALGLNQAVEAIAAQLLALACLASLAAWLAARTRLSARLGLAGLLLLGAAGLFVLTGQMLDELWGVLAAAPQARLLIAWGEPVQPWLPPLPRLVSLNAPTLAAALQALGLDVSSTALRLGQFFRGLAFGQAAYDPLAAGFVWRLAAWIMGGWAGWCLRRWRKPFAAISPAAAGLAALLYYRGQPAGLLVLMLGAAWLLSMYESNRQRLARWARAGWDSPEVALEAGGVALLLAAGLMTSAFMVTSFSISGILEQLARPAPAPVEGSPAQALGIRGGPGAPAFAGASAAGLPRQHLLQDPPELLEQPFLWVMPETGEGGLEEAGVPAAPQAAYWRSLTYDRYEGRGWSTSAYQETRYPANADQGISQPPGQPVRRLAQRITFASEPDGLLYSAGNPQRVDAAVVAAWRLPGDLLGIRLQAGEYRVESLVFPASAAALRQAGQVYPAEIQAAYLTLPADLPERVGELALRLTAAQPNAYDRALAIQDYLRRLPYSLEVPAPPAGRDVVDYFLFDLRQGYCDYYATAMAVLARAAGMPARLVTGYAGGTWDEARRGYLVTRAQAHSWTEVYFPGYGWVEFEPTAARPALQPLELPTAGKSGELPAAPPADALSLPRLAAWLAGAAAGLLLLGGLRLALSRLALLRLEPDAAAVQLFRRLGAWGARLGARPRPENTPAEFAARLAGCLPPAAREQVDRLTALYEASAYGPQPLEPASRRQALLDWDRLQAPLWRAWLRRLAGRLQRRVA